MHFRETFKPVSGDALIRAKTTTINRAIRYNQATMGDNNDEYPNTVRARLEAKRAYERTRRQVRFFL